MTKQPAAIWRQSQKLAQHLVKTGRVLTFTTIYSAPLGFEHQVPYSVGIIKFEDGTSTCLEIVDCKIKDLKIGLKVQTVIRRIGQVEPDELIEYGVKVKPASPAGGPPK